MRYSLRDFVIESNKIERIEGTSREEMEEYQRFLSNPITVRSLERFVDIVANAQLRNVVGLDVVIGGWRPIEGGRGVVKMLQRIIRVMPHNTPYATHQEYETLHPFTDGNGRSGRVLWLHQMGGIDRAPLGFLHHWYYQSLR